MIKKLSRRWRTRWSRLKLAWRWCFRRRAPAHGRSRELIVSLTSYPKRFSTLHLTLKSLLTQSVRPDRVILWLAEADKNAVPPAVAALQRQRAPVQAQAGWQVRAPPRARAPAQAPGPA